MSDSMSPLARTVAHALASLPPGAPAFGVELVLAVLDTDEPTAARVLDELKEHGIAVAQSDSTYTLADSVTAPDEGETPDAAPIEAAVIWFTGQVLLADRERDRDSKKVSPEYNSITTPKFCTPAEAMSWYEPHHTWFMDLLYDLVERTWHERVVTLAEAVFGLAGHLGLQQDQMHAAEEALRALDHLERYVVGLADGRHRDDDDVRHHHVRVARFRLMLAAVLTNLRDFGAALKSLGEAERRGRAADSIRVLAAVCRSRGRLHHAAGDLPEADRQLRAAHLADVSHGDRRLVALSLRRRGAVLSEMGDYDLAGVLLHEAAVYTAELSNPIANARVLTTTGAMYVASGQPQRAVEVLMRALDTMKQKEAGCDRYLADIYRYLAHAQRADDITAANQYLRQAVVHYLMAHDEHAAAALEAEWNQLQVAV